jgi:hypothetical protein
VFAHWGNTEEHFEMSDNRKAERDNLSFNTYAKTHGVSYRVVIQNMSNEGVMVVGIRGLVVGHKMEVKLSNGEWQAGFIRWAIEDRCGLEFATDR